jgi:hypothetical protein
MHARQESRAFVAKCQGYHQVDVEIYNDAQVVKGDASCKAEAAESTSTNPRKRNFAFVRLAAGGCADEAIENAESALTAVALLAVEPLTWTTGLQDIAPKAGAEAVPCSTNTLQDFLCVSGSRHQEVHRMFLSGAQVGLRDSAKFLQSLASAAAIAHTYAASIERHGAEKTAMVLVALSCKFWGMRLPNWKKLAEHLGLAPAEYIRLECDIVRNIKFDGNFAGLPAFAEGHDVF